MAQEMAKRRQAVVGEARRREIARQAAVARWGARVIRTKGEAKRAVEALPARRVRAVEGEVAARCTIHKLVAPCRRCGG